MFLKSKLWSWWRFPDWIVHLLYPTRWQQSSTVRNHHTEMTEVSQSLVSLFVWVKTHNLTILVFTWCMICPSYYLSGAPQTEGRTTWLCCWEEDRSCETFTCEANHYNEFHTDIVSMVNNPMCQLFVFISISSILKTVKTTNRLRGTLPLTVIGEGRCHTLLFGCRPRPYQAWWITLTPKLS